jgi:DNA ligase-1
MEFQNFSLALDQIETQTARLDITQSLANLWLQLTPPEIRPVANLIQGQLQPSYESLEFNLSEKMIARSLARLILHHGGLNQQGVNIDLFGQADEATIVTQVKKIHRHYGDWGQTTQKIHQDLALIPPRPLPVTDVYKRLVTLAQTSGEGSQETKLQLLFTLYQDVDDISAKIITRIVIGKLRLGFSTMTILDSLSWAGTGNKSESSTLESIYQKKADLGLLAKSYLANLSQSSPRRLHALQQNYAVTPGVPVVAALCQRLNSSHEIITKMTSVIAEPKYDGIRIQIHLQKTPTQSHLTAFTRSLENVSNMFPELHHLATSLKVNSLILDSEAVGYHQKTGKILPFQEIMTRRRKHDIATKSKQLPLKFFVFDILYLNGRELLTLPLNERKKLLSTIIAPSAWAQPTPYIITTNASDLHRYHQQQLAQGLEGVVAKAETSIYQSGRKGWNWVKIKEAEGTRGKLQDTLDLVVMGLYHGKGKRHSFGVGAFLVGVINEHGEILTLSKIGTGLTDADFHDLKAKATPLTVKDKPTPYHVKKILVPDIWLTPTLIAEIAADEITNSTTHTSGYGLRFPRLIRWREDKSATTATTVTELSTLASPPNKV